MAVSSSSSDAEVIAQFEDNVEAALGTEYDGAAAGAARGALTILLFRLPESGQFGGRSFNRASLESTLAGLKEVVDFAATSANAGLARNRIRFRRGRQ